MTANSLHAAVPVRNLDGREKNFAISLMQHLVVPTFVIDANCHVIIWNNACEELTGLAAAKVLGTNEHWRGFYDKQRPCLADLLAQNRLEEIATMYATHENLADGNDFGVHAENWCLMPHRGTKLYLAIDAGTIYHEDGRLLAVIETLRDITAHKQTHNALKDLAIRDGLTGQAKNIADFRASNETVLASLLETVGQICHANTSAEKVCSQCVDEQCETCEKSLTDLASSLMTVLLDHVNHEDVLMSLLPNSRAANEHCREHRARHAEFTTRMNRLISEHGTQERTRSIKRLEEFILDWIRIHALVYDSQLDGLVYESSQLRPTPAS